MLHGHQYTRSPMSGRRSMTSTPVQGVADERFAALRDAFQQHLDTGEELGASLAVVERGTLVARPLGRLGRPGADDAVDRGHAHQRLVDLQDHDVADGARPDRPRAARPRRARRHLLAGVQGRRQGGRAGPARAPAHLGRLRLGPARHRRGHPRRPRGDRPPRRAGAVVAAGHAVRLPPARLRAPGGRARPARHRPHRSASTSAPRSPSPLGADFWLGPARSRRTTA